MNEERETRKPLCQEIVRTYDDKLGCGLTTKIVTHWFDGQFGEHLSFDSITFVVEKTKCNKERELTIDRELAQKLVDLMSDCADDERLETIRMMREMMREVGVNL